MPTSNYSFPYPTLSDAPNVPQHIKALADAVDLELKTVADSVAGTTYTISTEDVASGAKLNLEADGSTTDSVNIIGGTNVTVTQSNSVITISADDPTATTATNLAGTTQYAIPYQSGSATTTYVSIGSAGQVLAVNGSANGYTWVDKSNITNLNSLTDVVITSPSAGQVLKYTETSPGIFEWTNGTDSTGGGGGSSISFTTINGTTGSVSAEIVGDTLALAVNGGGLTITASEVAGIDTLTFDTSALAKLSGASFTGNVSITNSVVGNTPFVVTAAASQSADIAQWKNSSGTNLVRVNSSGSLLVGAGISLGFAGTISMSYGQIGSGISGNMLSITNTAATERGITIRAHASQSVNLQEWQNSAGTILASISSSGGATFASLTVSGDLTVNGTTTNINTTNLVVEDKNVILGDVTTPSDITADGGGITLKGASDKTITWSSVGWTSSEDFNLLTGKVYEIAGTPVLSSTTLGSTVVNSSLTKVGLATAGFVKVDSSGNLSSDTTTYAPSALSGAGTSVSLTSNNYTLLTGDRDKLIEVSNTVATTVTVDSTLNSLPAGSQIHLLQTNSGQVTVLASGVTVNGTPTLKLRTQWSGATLIKRSAPGSGVWVLIGDLASS